MKTPLPCEIKLDPKYEDMGFQLFLDQAYVYLMNKGAILKEWPAETPLTLIEKEIHQTLCEAEFSSFVEVVR
ncbi:MAG: hypothetical protein PHV11_10055 [Candidatus Bipolaricaulis sp.]|nr:hypothetical protein [Candidatus Bipolaricaulis sp.]